MRTMSADAATAATEAAAPRFVLRRYPDLARVWFGHSLSLLGSHLSTLALPLLVLDMTGSAALAGLSAPSGCSPTWPPTCRPGAGRPAAAPLRAGDRRSCPVGGHARRRDRARGRPFPSGGRAAGRRRRRHGRLGGRRTGRHRHAAPPRAARGHARVLALDSSRRLSVALVGRCSAARSTKSRPRCRLRRCLVRRLAAETSAAPRPRARRPADARQRRRGAGM